ncbi:MAG: heparan-alpha-glucosaminide N-acetyltransferase domain-containing protein [Bacteroidota bacterium]
MTQIQTKRIESIDMLRGIVMVLMALDHVRDYFHIGANTGDPLDLQTTYPLLFFTRWITHFCAPVFIFLSGTSIFLQSQRKTPKELGMFVLKRGLWLIVAEWTIIAFGWTFNPAFAFIPFQVIWAIGISMVVLGSFLLMRIPYIVILGLGIVIVFGHNLLGRVEQAPDFQTNFWWDILHHGTFKPYTIIGNHNAILVYPFVPWTGLMMLGYCMGIFFTSTYSIAQRSRVLLGLGVGLLLFFVGLRYSNVYGDPSNWSSQRDNLYTFFSFMSVQKYPPSLLYMCATISIALLALAWLERLNNSFLKVMTVFGRTAFFYYILHIYIIHLLATIAFFARGHSFADGLQTEGHFPFLFVAPGEGYQLGVVYAVWIVVLVMLYPICKWYDSYKQNHKEKWWLSYV